MAGVEHWWIVKRYGNDPIEVTPKVAEYVKNSIVNGSENIVLNGNLLPTKGMSVEETRKIIQPDNIYLLADNMPLMMAAYGKGKPLRAPDFEDNGVTYEGGVLWAWYRMNIDRRSYDTYYGKSPGYYRVDLADQSVWVACRLIQYSNSEVPIQWVACTPEEGRILDGRAKLQ